GSFILGFFGGTERNRQIDTTFLNEREIFVPFGSVGGYRRSFSIKLLAIGSVRFRSAEKGKKKI
uniref:Ribosomal protein S3 n=1 Tax=Romanomermis culicivorax TaxID=13658 RepID=A0A915KWR2_ROMCU